MTWIVEFDPHAEKELSNIDQQDAKRILRFLVDRVTHLDDPRSIGEALKGSRLEGLWKYQVGSYRLISSIDDDAIKILLLTVGYRKDVYR